jgi:hypothetical protein
LGNEYRELQRGNIPGDGEWTDAAWLRGPNAQAFLGLLGDAKDTALGELRAGVKARWPGLGPPDALYLQGQGFDIERFPGESDDVYTARLQKAWQTHRLAGTSAAIVESLRAYGIVDVQVVEDWEGSFAPGSWYSRFWVILGPDFGTLGLEPLAMPFSLGNATLGTTATPEHVRAIKRQILKWKDTHGYPVGVLLRFGDPAVLGLGLSMPFPLGGAKRSGVAFWPMGARNMLGSMTMPFELGADYDV